MINRRLSKVVSASLACSVLIGSQSFASSPVVSKDKNAKITYDDTIGILSRDKQLCLPSLTLDEKGIHLDAQGIKITTGTEVLYSPARRNQAVQEMKDSKTKSSDKNTEGENGFVSFFKNPGGIVSALDKMNTCQK